MWRKKKKRGPFNQKLTRLGEILSRIAIADAIQKAQWYCIFPKGSSEAALP
jgi:hypothetical protein